MPIEPLEIYPIPDKRNKPAEPPVRATAVKRKWTGTLPDKFIATLVEQISESEITAMVNLLSSFHTRHTKSSYISQVADWVKNRFVSYGYTDLFEHVYIRDGYTLKNIVATKKGAGSTGETIMLCAHYDCIMEHGNDATAKAPGADDNASGVAALLEIARIIALTSLADDVMFVAFSGEEQGMWGSTAYAQYVMDNAVNIKRVINLDMIGYAPTGSSIYVEQDMGNMQASNDAASQQFASVMAQMGADYTDLEVSFGNIYSSDYMPFEARGYVCIGVYEKIENPNYHTSNDTPEKVNYSFISRVAKMVLATLVWETSFPSTQPDSGIDLYIRDNPSDDGNQPSQSPHWISPDIWVRNNPPDTPGENFLDGHQAPINDIPNYLYVRVHNRGTTPAPSCTVHAYRCNPSTGMIWPAHFTPIGSVTGTQVVMPGSSVVEGPFIWTPQITGHECLLAVASTEGDQPVTKYYSGSVDHSLLVRFDNNVGQRNVAPQPSVPGGKMKVSVMIRGNTIQTKNTLTIDAAPFPDDTAIDVRIPKRIHDAADSISEFVSVKSTDRFCNLKLKGGHSGTLEDFDLDKNETASILFTIDFSYEAEHGKTYPLEITQIQDGRIAGRYTVEIIAVKESDDWLYGNLRTKEVHLLNCEWRIKMKPHNVTPVKNIQEAKARGYDGCAYCMPTENTDNKT
ncbi:MAG: M20/M25/M40 family metallo-hydrolase [Chlorobiaceae bacterium]|nr:M20/M25/M40 family metallo-hydrolase [Chlorobiaceae bacterium]